MPGLFDTPDPPNPIATAAAQTGTNVSTALANQQLNQINQVTPQGNLSYQQIGTYDFTDPSTGQSYSLPKSQATQTLTPTGQNTFDQQQLAQYNLTKLGNEQAWRLGQQYGTPFNPNQWAPGEGNLATLREQPRAQTTFGNVGGPASGFTDTGQSDRTFGSAPEIQRSYQHGDDFSADRQRIEAGLMERLNPSLGQERQKYEQQLADQGIRYGSPAYENAMRNYSIQANDARLGVIGQGGVEQQRLSDMARMAGEFANKGQQQAYEQALGRGEFSNKAQQQAYEQAFGRAQFGNAAQQQGFSQEAMRGTFGNAALAQNFAMEKALYDAQNADRARSLNEQYALRGQPINETTALLAGSQVQQPNFIGTGQTTIPTTDIAGLMNRNFDQQMAASNQQAATANNIIGGLFGFAGGLGRGGAFNRA